MRKVYRLGSMRTSTASAGGASACAWNVMARSSIPGATSCQVGGRVGVGVRGIDVAAAGVSVEVGGGVEVGVAITPPQPIAAITSSPDSHRYPRCLPVWVIGEEVLY